MSTPFLLAGALTSQSLLLISKRVVELKLYLEYSPFPLQGYSIEEFYQYYDKLGATMPLLHLPLLVCQIMYFTLIRFVITATIVAARFISSRSQAPVVSILSGPCLMAGLAHTMECVCVLAYTLSKDARYVEWATFLSMPRAMLGFVGYFTVLSATLLSLGFSVMYIGRDDRQVIKNKKRN